MQHTTRNKFLVAVAAGVITCGGAVATATASNADPSSPAGTSSTSTSTATGAPTDPATTPSSPSGSESSTGSSTTTHPPLPHVTVKPFVTLQGNGKGQVSYRIDGEILAGPGNVIDYVEADIEVDGEHIPSAHPLPIGPDAPLRPIHQTHRNPFLVDLAPGKHTVQVRLAYYYEAGKFTTVTATRTFTVSSGTTPTTAPSTRPSDPGGDASGEPPTPSPKTTDLGVTG